MANYYFLFCLIIQGSPNVLTKGHIFSLKSCSAPANYPKVRWLWPSEFMSIVQHFIHSFINRHQDHLKHQHPSISPWFSAHVSLFKMAFSAITQMLYRHHLSIWQAQHFLTIDEGDLPLCWASITRNQQQDVIIGWIVTLQPLYWLLRAAAINARQPHIISGIFSHDCHSGAVAVGTSIRQ